MRQLSRIAINPIKRWGPANTTEGYSEVLCYTRRLFSDRGCFSVHMSHV